MLIGDVECGKLENKNDFLPWIASFGSYDNNTGLWKPICDAVLVVLLDLQLISPGPRPQYRIKLSLL